MTKSDVLSWVATEFLPLTLATPTATIEQMYGNAVRYINTHSAFKTVHMVDHPVDGSSVVVDKCIKDVVEVFPDRTTTWIFESHPLWTLLGITIVDNVTTDLILLAEAYRNFRNYLGVQMVWKFEPNADPGAGGSLYVRNLPAGASKLYVVGTRRITPAEDIVSEHMQYFLLNYTKALVKVVEGNTLRKADIINVKNDGQAMLDEGFDEKKALEERLSKESRWVAFAQRF